MLKLKLQYFSHLMRRANSLEKTLMLGKIEGRRRGWQRMRRLDGWTQRTWVWASSGSWSWNSSTLATWCEELIHLKIPWCWKRLKAGGEGKRGWDGWMTSPTQWTYVWASSRRWETGKSGMLPWSHRELDIIGPFKCIIWFNLANNPMRMSMTEFTNDDSTNNNDYKNVKIISLWILKCCTKTNETCSQI